MSMFVNFGVGFKNENENISIGQGTEFLKLKY